jgi:hypothetical protein
VAAGEDQTQSVILNLVLVPLRRVESIRLKLFGGSSSGASARACRRIRSIAVETASGYQPCSGTCGNTIAGPLFHGSRNRVMERLLGQIEVSNEANEGGEHTARLAAHRRFFIN